MVEQRNEAAEYQHTYSHVDTVEDVEVGLNH